ncbi:MAG: hypothetical protein IH991_01410 [Planctomycetes bacterium]|nr:hypothetical protein [Planctomycetota bacterium]
MRTTIHHLFAGLLVFGISLPSLVIGQDEPSDPVTADEPESSEETSAADESTLTDNPTIRIPAVLYPNRIYAFGGGLSGYVHHSHPAPFYAYGRRGIDATRYHNWNFQQSMVRPWHGNYSHTQWGAPLALVVPPTADTKTILSWGVGQTRFVPLYHQFHRGVPTFSQQQRRGYQFQTTPMWPSNTEQFGVYPIRGPW